VTFFAILNTKTINHKNGRCINGWSFFKSRGGGGNKGEF